MNHVGRRMVLVVAAMAAIAVSASAQEVLRQSGSLSRSDARLPDGKYVDWHPLTMAANTRYIIVVEGGSLDDTYMILKFPDGVTMENDDLVDSDAGIVFTSVRAETVQIGATSYSDGETGSYTVIARRTASPRALQAGQTENGVLGSTSGEPVRLDSYMLSGAKGDRVRILLSSDDFDPRLKVQTRSGHQDENDDSDGNSSALSYLFLDQGQLEIQVRGQDNSDRGDYELRVERLPAARTLEAGRSMTGRITDVAEEFVLSGRRGQIYEIEARSSDIDTVLVVTDSLGRKARNDDAVGADGNDSLLHYVFGADGMVSVSVGSYDDDESGSFRVSVMTSEAPTGYPMGRPQSELEDGGIYRGYLGTDAERNGDKYAHRFTFQGDEDEAVHIELSSDYFDAYLEVMGPGGETDYTDDDSGGDLDAQIDMVCSEAGLYTVTVTSASDWNVGFYEIGFNRGGTADTQMDESGSLERQDGQDISGKYYDVYTIEAEDGDSFVVDMESDDFDSYLYVWPPSGEDIQSDDDGGSDLAARIQVSDAEGGTWTIYATSNSPNETGDYRIRVSRY